MAASSGSYPAADEDGKTSPAIDLRGLVQEHHAAIYRYACRLAGCPSEAEDLTQQAFLIAHQRLAQLRDPSRARAWLLAVVRSCFLKSVRRPRPAPAQNFDLNIDEVADRTPAVAAVDGEALKAALGQLPDEFRLVLLMFYFEELSYHEIADQLQLPIGTVMSRLSRAKNHLRKKLTTWPAAAPPKRPLFRPATAPAAMVGAYGVRALP
jgi:RNA polymerase sigma-70 factor (ECF subfamily)